MFSIFSRAALTALAVSALAGPAAGQGRQDQPEMRRDRQRQEIGHRARGQQSRSITGRITDIRTVSLRGEREKHVLAKVRLGSGRTVTVDLGTPQELRRRKVQLQKGRTITVSGRAGTINQRQVLVAERVRGDRGRDILIVRVIPREGGRMADAAQYDRTRGARDRGGETRTGERARRSPYRVVTGRLVDESTTTTFKGLEGARHLIKIRAMDGRTHVVELGKADQLQDIRLQKGELLTVIGREGRINNKRVIVASHVADLVTIDRSEDRKAQAEMIQKRRQQKAQARPQQTQPAAGDWATQNEPARETQAAPQAEEQGTSEFQTAPQDEPTTR